MDWLCSEKKFPSSWCYLRADDRSEMSRKKKNRAPWWFKNQKKILGAKGGSWRSKEMETTVYQSINHKEEIHIFHKFMDLLVSSIINTNNWKTLPPVMYDEPECRFEAPDWCKSFGIIASFPIQRTCANHSALSWGYMPSHQTWPI